MKNADAASPPWLQILKPGVRLISRSVRCDHYESVEVARKLESLNKRHSRTLNAIFAQPISGNIKWRDVEALLGSVGSIISERAGSRVGVQLNDRVAVFHRPHPSPNMDKGAVRDLRRFLENTGIAP